MIIVSCCACGRTAISNCTNPWLSNVSIISIFGSSTIGSIIKLELLQMEKKNLDYFSGNNRRCKEKMALRLLSRPIMRAHALHYNSCV